LGREISYEDSLLAVVPAQNNGNNQSREEEGGLESVTEVRAGWLWDNHYYDCPSVLNHHLSG
jgi:hypothetical protein